MEAPQQYCLRWKYHHSNLQAMFSQLLERECFCDVTLACGGKTLKAHKVMLSACSTYFDSILSQHEEANGPITVILKDVKYSDIKALVQFMYKGEINVDNSELTSLLKTAEELRIKGLAEVSWRSEKEMQDAVRGGDDDSEVEEEEEDEPPQPPAPKRMRCDATWNPATAAAVAHQQQLQQQQQQHQQQMNKSINHQQQQQQLQHSMSVKEEAKEDDSDDGERDYKWASNMRSRSNSLSSPQQLANAMFMAGQQRHDINKSPLAVAMHRAAMQSNMSGGNAGMVYQQVAARLSNNGPTTYLTVQLGAAGGAGGGGGAGGSSGGGDEDQQQQRYAALQQQQQQQQLMYATGGGSNSNADSQSNASTVSTFDASQFPDVMKMNDYLESGGRRPQFWEEPFTKKVMESIKNKELEMKVAAELMGVSYGTLYGRYRDAYGCLKHPYRIRDFWTEAGPAEVIGKLQRKEISMFRAAEMLNVTVTTLANYLTTLKSGGGSTSSSLPASSTHATNVEDADIASDELDESMEEEGGPRVEVKYGSQPQYGAQSQDTKHGVPPQFGAQPHDTKYGVPPQFGAQPHDEADDPSMVTDDNDNRMEMLCKMEMREEDSDRPIVTPISPGGVNGAHE